MRLRPFIQDTDFEVIRNWITDERMHALWCGNRFSYPLEKEDFSRVIRKYGIQYGDCPFVMTRDDGKVAGFFCYSLNPETSIGMLKFVMVDPALRGKGTGKAMLKLAVEYAFTVTGAEAVQLAVFPMNTPAVRCYEHTGFTAIKTDTGAFRFRDESWDRCRMEIRRISGVPHSCGQWTVRYNELNANQFIELWESVWDGAPTPEQTTLALEHSVFRLSVFDGDRIIAMARMIGDLGLCYYIKDVIVRPEYQHRGIGKLMIQELLAFIRQNGINETKIFVELCAMPDKMPFYEKFGFKANEAQRLRIMYPIK